MNIGSGNTGIEISGGKIEVREITLFGGVGVTPAPTEASLPGYVYGAGGFAIAGMIAFIVGLIWCCCRNNRPKRSPQVPVDEPMRPFRFVNGVEDQLRRSRQHEVKTDNEKESSGCCSWSMLCCLAICSCVSIMAGFLAILVAISEDDLTENEKCKLYEGKELWGHDFRHIQMVNITECCRLCINDPECYSFAWNEKHDGECWLKTMFNETSMYISEKATIGVPRVKRSAKYGKNSNYDKNIGSGGKGSGSAASKAKKANFHQGSNSKDAKKIKKSTWSSIKNSIKGVSLSWGSAIVGWEVWNYVGLPAKIRNWMYTRPEIVGYIGAFLALALTLLIIIGALSICLWCTKKRVRDLQEMIPHPNRN